MSGHRKSDHNATGSVISIADGCNATLRRIAGRTTGADAQKKIDERRARKEVEDVPDGRSRGGVKNGNRYSDAVVSSVIIDSKALCRKELLQKYAHINPHTIDQWVDGTRSYLHAPRVRNATGRKKS